MLIVFNKPFNVLSQFTDRDGRRTLAGFIRMPHVRAAGRLDYDSEGLLLLTDDGALARDLMHPSRRVPRTYQVQIRGAIDESGLRRLARGVVLDGRRTQPAKVGAPRGGWIEITLREGRNRQVRRMLETLGQTVLRLKRVAYGGVELGRLRKGGLRELARAEVACLRRHARGRRAPAAGPADR